MHLWPQTMVHLILAEYTLQWALHRVTTDRSVCEARPGIMWAARALALGGRDGVLRVHMCMECTRAQFGRQGMMGIVVGRILVAGALVVRKWLVA